MHSGIVQTSAIAKTDSTVSRVCTHLSPPMYSNVSICHAFSFPTSVISINEWMDGWMKMLTCAMLVRSVNQRPLLVLSP